jgi:hypothetical protein
MCTDLNNCCPKDDFPLARIDKIMDSAADCEIMMLSDVFQITTKYGFAERMKKKQAS